MKKKFICIILLLVCIPAMFTGCVKTAENEDADVINNGAINIGVLLSNSSVASDISKGLSFAHSLANTIILGENIKVNISEMHYNDVNDVVSAAKELVAQSVSSIIFYGDSPEISKKFEEFISSYKTPVVSINSTNETVENIFSVGISPMYVSSCAATYALEKNYSSCALILEASDDYYSDFAQTYKSTLYNYCGVEPTVYYVNGEEANYTPSLLCSGNYEYVLLNCNSQNREDIVLNLRNAGFSGEIMLTEMFDKSSVSSDIFNNCSFISKLEEDSSNNISTVFYSMYSEFSGVNQDEINAAASYGYDAYMVIFEALKSFSPNSGNYFFDETTKASESCSEIKQSDLSKAIMEITYYGVTDKITFSENRSVPTYIYVDNIINGEVVFANKYTFSSVEH